MACGDRVYVESVIRARASRLERYLDPYDRRISIEVHVCREPENLHDRRAVCIKKGGVSFGHVPRELTAILVNFMDHGGAISCSVRGRPQQGKGLEFPCSYILAGKKKLLTEMQKYLSTLHISIDSTE